MKQTFATLLVAVCFAQVIGHGFLSHPKARNWKAAIGPHSTTKEYCPHCLSAGGVSGNQNAYLAATGKDTYPYPETEESSARHGLCGDKKGTTERYLVPESPTTTYVKGQVVEFEVVITAHHAGHFEFAVCDIDDGNQFSQTCLNQNILERVEDSNDVSPIDSNYPGRYYLEPINQCLIDKRNISGAMDPNDTIDHVFQQFGSALRVRMKYKLPENMTCSHCVLQWWWVSANSCNPPGYRDYSFPSTIDECTSISWWQPNMANCGGSWPEEFWNCADIKILSSPGATDATNQPTTQDGTASVTTAAPSPPTTGAPVTTGPPTTTASPSSSGGWGLQVTNAWGDACDVVMSLTFPTTVSTWTLELTIDRSLTTIQNWNADLSSRSTDGTVYTFTAKSYNAAQNAGAKLDLSMQFQGTGGQNCAEVLSVKVNGVLLAKDGQGSGSTTAGAASTTADSGSTTVAASTTIGLTTTAQPASTQTSSCSTTPKYTSEGAELRVDGQPIRLKGVNWFGYEENTFSLHGCWSFQSAEECYSFMFNFIKTNKFNALRIPVSMIMIARNPTVSQFPFTGRKALDVLEETIQRAAKEGILIMLDLHRITPQSGITPLWYDPTGSHAQDGFEIRSTDDIKPILTTMVQRYGHYWNMFAIDLKNEPHGATWGTGTLQTDWNTAAQTLGQHIIDIGGKMLVFVEGVGNEQVDGADTTYNHWWGENLQGVKKHPIQLSNPKQLVYSPHSYGPSVHVQPYHPPNIDASLFPANLRPIWESHFGFLTNTAVNERAVVLGEWGGRYTGNDKLYQDEFAKYISEKNMGSFYWCINPNSGDTGGLLQGDWRTPEQGKLNMLAVAHPVVTNFTADSSGCLVSVETPGISTTVAPSPPPSTTAAPSPPPSTTAPPATTDSNIGVCGKGTHLENNACVADIVCGPGTTLESGECVASCAGTCSDGTELVDGECVGLVNSCGVGTELVNGACVPMCTAP
eukprot:m.37038 g.37038  ORF g.37038 m.37038 type:complete len:975 (+) comp9235_c0_seq1:305-3229(+)